MSNPNQAVQLTAEQLKDLMMSMAAELRKPADPTPEQLAAKATEMSQRQAIAEGELEKIERRRQEQASCSHVRRDGSSSCVYVYAQSNIPASGNYLVCQQCQAMIHPEPRPTGALGKELEQHIFNTQLFNIHYQKAMTSATTF